MKRALVALALLVVLAGCHTPTAAPADQPGPTTTAQAGPAAVDWANSMCSAILEFDGKAPRFEIDSSTPAAMIASLTTFLDAMSARINDAVSKLQALGPSPVDGGEQAAQAMVGALQQLRFSVERSRTRLTGVDPNDRPGTSAALQDIAKELQNLREPVNPLEGMSARYPDLQAAARSADNCTEVSRARGSRSATPPTPTEPTSAPPPTS